MGSLTKLLAKKRKHALDLLAQNRLTEVKAACHKLLKKNPTDSAAWYMLGTVESRMGDLVAAEKAMCQSLQANAELPEGWLGLGQVLELQGKPDDASKTYLKALSINPKLVEANVALGRIYVSMQMFLQALGPLETALKIDADQPQVNYLYADALTGCGRHAQAFEVFKRLLEQFPDHVELLCKIGSLHVEFSELDQARACFEKALEIEPSHIGAKLVYIGVLRLQKNYGLALPEIDALFESEPNNIKAAILYSYLCHLNDSCEKVTTRLEGFLNTSDLTKIDEINVCFELGRLCDARADYDKAFAFYNRGNRLKAGQYDSEYVEALASAWIEGYNREAMQQNKLGKQRERGRPIFVIGMPRSGTTLVEQILSTHSDVYGAGELGDMVWLVRGYRGDDYPLDKIRREAINFLPDDLADMADRYRSHLDKVSAGERYVVDKLPGNFMRLGLIAMLFPDAKIIHCKRNPVDTCLSCYFHDFTGVHPYLYDMDNLASFYKNYQRLMEHWHKSLPLPILDVCYEDVVAEQEGESRRMFEFLELDWDEHCLEFYNSDRDVVTSSHDQVQKPIYKSSISRWKNYEKHIQPLIRGLSE